MENQHRRTLHKLWAPVYDRVMGSPAGLTIERDEPSLLHGQYRIVLLHQSRKN
jgi:hypothetical protein